MHTLLLQGDFHVNMLAELMKQGPLIGLLTLICWLLYKKTADNEKAMDSLRNKHEADMREMNDKLERYMTTDRKELLTALNNNTEAFQDLKETMGKR